ncbi:Gtpase activating protein [Coemansia sp. RSA 1722]|nr:Gtpase activating protein [Coemansia sp. RSA 486]KAJ2235279.1 Protein gts1 [Coemansia sp. RSA 485]KAJ2596722.1 Gtpase activating protein [Coemansia sp. RSA 1722]KAJ2600684.1 Gtpase activating protein [Coemansia sp. RSA 1721]KAJ2637490.1 Gtpase activating protein [Coemansia sp. RSA 1286]
MVVVTDKEKKRLAEKHNRLLSELVKQPGNNTCADCGASGPRWASWNLGVFLCIRCGGFHRHLGTHITKVKSINLDNWTPEQIEHFRQIGNVRANAFFNPRPELHALPRSDRDVERYIREKYERRLFVDPRNGIPDPTVPDAAPANTPKQHRLSVSAAPDEAAALTQLREMGFVNVRDNHAALKRFAFNVDAAAAYLRGESPRPRIAQSDARVMQLAGMGFDHAGQNARALEMCDGDINRAIELLLSDNAPPRTASPEKTPAPAQSAKPAAAATLLDNDFFGSPAPASLPAKPSASANLTDLLGGLSIASASASPPAPAPAPASTQKSQDLFADFGDFLSATSPAPTMPQATTSPAPAAPQAAAPQASAAPKPNQGGQTLFDNDFIMSLYSKAPTGSSSSASASGAKPATTSQNGASASDAFGGLDFFM